MGARCSNRRHSAVLFASFKNVGKMALAICSTHFVNKVHQVFCHFNGKRTQMENEKTNKDQDARSLDPRVVTVVCVTSTSRVSEAPAAARPSRPASNSEENLQHTIRKTPVNLCCVCCCFQTPIFAVHPTVLQGAACCLMSPLHPSNGVYLWS